MYAESDADLPPLVPSSHRVNTYRNPNALQEMRDGKNGPLSTDTQKS